MLVLEARKKFKTWKEIGRHNCERLVNFHRLFCLLLSLLVYLFLKHVDCSMGLGFAVCPRQPNQGLQLCNTNALTWQKGSWTLIACGEMHTFYFTFLLVKLFLFLMSINMFLSLFVPCQRSKSELLHSNIPQIMRLEKKPRPLKGNLLLVKRIGFPFLMETQSFSWARLITWPRHHR